ncbi:MAG TPA: DNA translocase FtsK 4TM domain-containing protein, partial [Verrucomicrobiae bacterium]
MAQKSGTDSKHGWNDVIGIVLLLAAVLLVFSQLSFDPNEISFLTTDVNRPHNWVGPFGAYVAWLTFLPLGLAGYLLPVIFSVFGVAYLLGFLGYLRENLRWSLLWTVLLLVAVTGLLNLLGNAGWMGHVHENIAAQGAGGWLGYLTYGQSHQYNFGFSLFGPIGATIVYAALGLVSLLFLTNFHLGGWIHALLQKAPAAADTAGEKSEDELVLERRARELEKQKRKLEDEVERSEKVERSKKTDRETPREPSREASGLGADGLPVPEPTVRDLSVPQAKGPNFRKSTYPEKPGSEPVKEGETISASEVRAATTSADILGKKSGKVEPKVEEKIVEPESAAVENTGAPKVEPIITIADGSAPAPTSAPVAAPKPKLAPRKPKPITVASTPLIGNYQLPPMDFLQYPDLTARPTESKEELMANARLMQQSLAQFSIEVSLGDITKGPTITRYELHPAPGVKLEKILALSNNLAAALKAERIHILAPVPGKSSVGVEVPNAIKTKVIMRDLFESEEWRNTKARIPIALGKDVYGHPIVADLAEMPHCLIAGSTGSGKSVCINSIIASLLYRFSPDQLRFVMIDPKVVELQQYNSLPHLVVPVVTDPKKVLLALRWVVNEME